ncbi:hypothetical protein HPP92_008497 [Vanilla planifolia]|uniref:Uncharacterized protein n=1 Tax=Vanilla planifolia TaxID=51239 RepID=A0A835V401_VANPL|nr:hypothetical protein HPP92_008676 [Vanilla planifolia]KAG0486402.1 hypothetical protein HPP92_008497 [Vanilla planifolia]
MSHWFSGEQRYARIDGQSAVQKTEFSAILARRWWRRLWKRVMKEKKRAFDARPSPARLSYDLCSYAQNFDERPTWVEHDNLPWSFSARFAVPSRYREQFIS